MLGAVASIPDDRAHPGPLARKRARPIAVQLSKQQPIRTPADACSSPDRVWADAASFETLARRPLQASAATVPGRPHPEAEVHVRQRHRPAASIRDCVPDVFLPAFGLTASVRTRKGRLRCVFRTRQEERIEVLSGSVVSLSGGVRRVLGESRANPPLLLGGVLFGFGRR